MTRPRVFATQRLPGDALERLAEAVELDVWPERGAPPRNALRAAAREAEGLLCLLTDRIDAPLLAGCPALRVVSSVSVGVDHVDLAAASGRGIPVGHTPGVLTETTADLAFGLLLAAARRIPEADSFVRGGSWSPERVWEPDLLLGRDVHGATLGIVGLGAIGQAMARRAAGFGMRILGASRTRRDVPGVEPCDLPELLEHSDFVSLHVPLSDETRHLIDGTALARMRRGAILVNTARGAVVDESALYESLVAGHLAGAGLDVFEREPIDASHPLCALPNVVFAPHIGSASHATRERMVELAIDNLRAGLRGDPLPHCANPQVEGAPDSR